MSHGSRGAYGSGTFVALAITALATCALWGLSPSVHVSPALRMTAFALLAIVAVAFVLLHPRGWSGKQTVIVLLSIAAVARILLLPHPPTDDMNRYLWEGLLVREGISPYAQPAEAAELEPLRDEYWAEMNHRDAYAVYPPLAQLAMAGIGLIAYEPLVYKTVFALADMGVVALLLVLLHRRRLALRFAWLYAMNPVVLFAFAGEGHYDSLFLLPLAAALLALERRRFGWAWAALAAAIQVKLMAVVLIPALLAGREGRRACFWALPVLLAPALPFLDTLDGLARGLMNFGGGMAYNGSLHAVAWWLLGSREAGSIVMVALLGLWSVLVLFAFKDPLRRSFLLFGGLIAVAPTVHYWYLSWPILLLPFFPHLAWIWLSGAAALTFSAWAAQLETGQWLFPAWAQMLIWIPFWLIVLMDAPRFWTRLRHVFRKRIQASREPAPRHAHQTLAVIIPAIDEADRLELCLHALGRQSVPPDEIIVVDGGSVDDTVAVGKRLGATLVHAARGRGIQIAAGLQVAHSDLILVCHADAVAYSDLCERIRVAMAGDPDALGGSAGQIFNGESWRLLLVEALNDVRTLFFGNSFGDQGQFFRRETLETVSGFPAFPLMEDVEWSLRLKQVSPVLYLGEGLTLSDRRWRRDGWFRRIVSVPALCLKYRLRRGVESAEACYRIYYPAVTEQVRSLSKNGSDREGRCGRK